MIDPSLQEYVRQSKANGLADDAIRASLAASGWSGADIDVALSAAAAPTSVPPSALAEKTEAQRSKAVVPLVVAAVVFLIGGGAFAFYKVWYPAAPAPAPSTAMLVAFPDDVAEVRMNFEWADGQGGNYGLSLGGEVDLQPDAPALYNGTLIVTDFPESRTPLRSRFSTYLGLAGDDIYLSFRQARTPVPPADRLIAGDGAWLRTTSQEVMSSLTELAPQLGTPVAPWLALKPSTIRELRRLLSESGAVTLMQPPTEKNEAEDVALYAATIDKEKFVAFAREAYRVVIGRKADAAAEAKIAATAEHFSQALVIAWTDASGKNILRLGAMPKDGVAPQGYKGLTTFDIFWTKRTTPLKQPFAAATGTLDAFIIK